MYTNKASLTLAGPFSKPLSPQSSRSADCGIFVTGQYSAVDTFCGYRYYKATGDHKPGMGCKTGWGKDGALWVR